MRRSSLTTIAVAAALAVAAPAAQARVAVDAAPPAPGTHLSLGALHRVDGAQAAIPSSPVPVTDPAPVDTGGGGDPLPYVLVAVPLALGLAAGGARRATHRTFLPRRGSHARV
jgi:hypothetical protein